VKADKLLSHDAFIRRYLPISNSTLGKIKRLHVMLQLIWLRNLFPVLRACTERRKEADRKKKEEKEAKQERTEEEQNVHML
jgi:hypothetical protein